MHEVNFEKLSKLQCILFPGKEVRCRPEFLEYYNKAYLLWREMLKEGFRSENLLDEAKKLKSDDFLRHEEIACLFDGMKPVGLLMFDWMNFSVLPTLERQYISIFPDYIIKKVKENAKSIVMTIGHLTIDLEWRKKKIGPGVSEILTGFMTKRFLESQANALLFTTRNTRSTQKLAYEHGGIPLLQNFEVYGVPADIIIMYRDSIKSSDIEGIPELTDQLWRNKITAIMNPLQNLNR